MNRWRPSHTLSDVPSGCTSHTRTNTSTWSRLDVTCSSADTGPISSSGSVSSSPVYTSTSARASSGRLSRAPPVSMPMPPDRRRRVGGVVAVAVRLARRSSGASVASRPSAWRYHAVGVAGGGQSSKSRHVPPSPCTCTRDRALGEELGLVAQVGVEPVERCVGHAALAATAEVAAGADAQVHGRGRVAQDRVVVEHAGQRVVVPAVDQQDGDVPVGEHGAEVRPRPRTDRRARRARAGRGTAAGPRR